MRILLLEDEEDLAEIIIEGMKSRKHEALWGKNLEEGSQIYHEVADTLDCIILDYCLEGENGLEFLTKIRKSNGDKVPVIVISGYLDQLILDDISVYENTVTLSKPIPFKDLIAEVEKMTKAVA